MQTDFRSFISKDSHFLQLCFRWFDDRFGKDFWIIFNIDYDHLIIAFCLWAKAERQEPLIEFLGLFARRDAIPDNQFEFSPDSDTELSNSDNESK